MIIPRPPEPVTTAEARELTASALAAVAEAERARQIFPRFASLIEAEGIIREEADELSEALREAHGSEDLLRRQRVVAEALQVAAMALRIVAEVRGTL